jgi:hypothetical protein
MKKLFLFILFFILSTTAQSQSKGWGEYSKTDKLTGVKSPAYMMIQEKMDIPGFPKAMLLNGTTPTLDPICHTYINDGCAGHPSFAQNILAFERMQPIVEAALRK